MGNLWYGFLIGQLVWAVPLAIVGLVAWFNYGDGDY